MKRSSWTASLALLLAGLLGACASGKTFVVKPPATKVTSSTLTIVEEGSTVEMPQEERAAMQKRLEDRLYAKDGFVRGPDLFLKWRYVQFSPGSQVARWAIGFGAGKGSLAIEGKFYDVAGNELASVRSEGEISGGFFGGSFSEASDKAADELAEYARKYFR